jgi:hypothetical protein
MIKGDGMRINLQIEPLVREAMAAAIGQDPKRSYAALQKMADGGDEVAQDCATLATLISTIALLDLSDGEPPADVILQEMAQQLAQMESWADIDESTAYALLAGVAGRDDRQPVPPETFMRLIFVVAAWLLGAFGPDERTWYDYLDQILLRIETKA